VLLDVSCDARSVPRADLGRLPVFRMEGQHSWSGSLINPRRIEYQTVFGEPLLSSIRVTTYTIPRLPMG
jgi:hypothetical protein